MTIDDGFRALSVGDGDCMEREITTVKCFKTNLESVLLQCVQGRRGEKMSGDICWCIVGEVTSDHLNNDGVNDTDHRNNDSDRQ